MNEIKNRTGMKSRVLMYLSINVTDCYAWYSIMKHMWKEFQRNYLDYHNHVCIWHDNYQTVILPNKEKQKIQ